ncbi:MAG: NIPSNAP family containing protein, partial [Planctomycetes bacterium]|nr:NIPSNAP family containing protein [Planctomycetota bacterium]
MKRREFLAASCVAGMTAVSANAATAGGQGQRRGTQRAGESRTGRRSRSFARDIYELRQYHCDSANQQKGLDDFLCKVMTPALNRLGIDKVGVFHEREASDSPTVYVLIRHKSSRSVLTTTAGLLKDEKFLADGKAFLDGGNDKPGYSRMESGLMIAFDGMKRMQSPAKKDTRVFQLRTYESPSIKTGQKKIEMFNVAEIDIFRKTGLNPVFFSESITGSK